MPGQSASIALFVLLLENVLSVRPPTARRVLLALPTGGLHRWHKMCNPSGLRVGRALTFLFPRNDQTHQVGAMISPFPKSSARQLRCIRLSNRLSSSGSVAVTAFLRPATSWTSVGNPRAFTYAVANASRSAYATLDYSLACTGGRINNRQPTVAVSSCQHLSHLSNRECIFVPSEHK